MYAGMMVKCCLAQKKKKKLILRTVYASSSLKPLALFMATLIKYHQSIYKYILEFKGRTESKWIFKERKRVSDEDPTHFGLV